MPKWMSNTIGADLQACTSLLADYDTAQCAMGVDTTVTGSLTGTKTANKPAWLRTSGIDMSVEGKITYTRKCKWHPVHLIYAMI